MIWIKRLKFADFREMYSHQFIIRLGSLKSRYKLKKEINISQPDSKNLFIEIMSSTFMHWCENMITD